jgi:hypothetical protein
MVCNLYTLSLKTFFVFFQVMVAALESFSMDNVEGDVPEFEKFRGAWSPVLDPIRFVGFTMLIEGPLRRRCSSQELKIEGLRTSSEI